jgi:hypothetical protein
MPRALLLLHVSYVGPSVHQKVDASQGQEFSSIGVLSIAEQLHATDLETPRGILIN